MKEEEFLQKVEEAANKLKKLRGEVIHNAIDIEKGIEATIIKYYIKDEKHSEFLMKCMFDEHFSFGLKIKIFKKTFPDEPYKGFFDEIGRLNNLRNIFAHSPMASLNGELIHNKDLKLRVKQAEALQKEFYELHPRILRELNELLSK